MTLSEDKGHGKNINIDNMKYEDIVMLHCIQMDIEHFITTCTVLEGVQVK